MLKITHKTLIITLYFIYFSCSLILDCYSWSGYDYDNKVEIEIEEGNLVKEGLVIEFYDSNSDDYHNAKILFIESDSGNSMIRLHDLDLDKKRIFIMQD